MSIYVTKSFLPPIEEYTRYIESIYANSTLTNQGPLLKKLEEKLSNFLQVQNFQYVTNGTIALQLALSALDINEGEIITTPFSYVATISSILWQRCKPIFVDIETDNFTIDVAKMEKKITPKTKAIMGVHVFGYACNVEKIQEIADKHNLKVIYDGAHAFATTYKEKSLLDYGDISTLSFHATKLFHTVEGGACVVKETKQKIDYLFIQVHAGVEQVPLPLPEWRIRYMELIDNGADAIIASHPHTPQGYETYKNKMIFYSLGNFFFDKEGTIPDFWNKGIIVLIEILDNGNLEIKRIPIEKNDDAVMISTNKEYELYLDHLADRINSVNYRKEIDEMVLTLWEERYKNYYNGVFPFRFIKETYKK